MPRPRRSEPRPRLLTVSGPRREETDAPDLERFSRLRRPSPNDRRNTNPMSVLPRMSTAQPPPAHARGRCARAYFTRCREHEPPAHGLRRQDARPTSSRRGVGELVADAELQTVDVEADELHWEVSGVDCLPADRHELTAERTRWRGGCLVEHDPTLGP